MTSRRGPAAAPVWGLLTLPFGVTVGFATVTVPFVLQRQGLSMTQIATITQVAALPHVVKLLWSPALDAGPRRRTWFFGCVGIMAACLAAVVLSPPSNAPQSEATSLWAFAALLTLAQLAAAVSGSAILALLAVTVPYQGRGVATGWQSAGNLVGTAGGGALATWMTMHLSPGTAAAALAAFCVTVASPAVAIAEAPLPRRPAGALFRDLTREIADTLRSRVGWTALVICLSPVGAGGVTNLLSALARDYARDDQEAERLVIVVSGVLAGIVNAAGAVVGGYLADRMNHRLLYFASAGLMGVCAVGMMLVGASPLTFTVGSLAYQAASGVSFAAFYAFVLDVVGERSGVATGLALYTGASNLANVYVTWLDGWAYDRVKVGWRDLPGAGRFGLLGMDAATTFLGIGLLAMVTSGVKRGRSGG